MWDYEEKGYDGSVQDLVSTRALAETDPPGVRVLDIKDLVENGPPPWLEAKVFMVDPEIEAGTKFVYVVTGSEVNVFLTCNFCEEPLDGSFQFVWWENARGEPQDVKLAHYKCAHVFESMDSSHEWFRKGHRPNHASWTLE